VTQNAPAVILRSSYWSWQNGSYGSLEQLIFKDCKLSTRQHTLRQQYLGQQDACH